jgi:hypothetical protein
MTVPELPLLWIKLSGSNNRYKYFVVSAKKKLSILFLELKEVLRVQIHAEVPLHLLFGNWDMHN